MPVSPSNCTSDNLSMSTATGGALWRNRSVKSQNHHKRSTNYPRLTHWLAASLPLICHEFTTDCPSGLHCFTTRSPLIPHNADTAMPTHYHKRTRKRLEDISRPTLPPCRARNLNAQRLHRFVKLHEVLQNLFKPPVLMDLQRFPCWPRLTMLGSCKLNGTDNNDKCVQRIWVRGTKEATRVAPIAPVWTTFGPSETAAFQRQTRSMGFGGVRVTKQRHAVPLKHVFVIFLEHLASQSFGSHEYPMQP